MSIPVSTIPIAAAPDTLSRHPLAEQANITFARRRLRLGITGVGTSVVLAFVWLLLLLIGVGAVPDGWRPFGLPTGAAGMVGAAGTAALLTLCVFLVHAALLFAVEYAGGVRTVRVRPALGSWLRSWARGMLVQGGLLVAFTFAAALAAQLAGWIGLVSAVLGGAVALLVLQGLVARAIATLPVTAADAPLSELALSSGVRPQVIRVVHAEDEAFVGGWIGLGTPQLWIPRRWTEAANEHVLRVQLARRHAQFTSGARRRGLWRAAAWPVIGVALFAPMLPWSYANGTLWLALPAVSTLWSFVAVLLLPSLSRPVVYSADASASARLGADAVVQATRTLDAWQDDEPERSAGVEFIFHPVPSRNNRERALRRGVRPTLGGGHQQTRLTLYSSLAAGSLLGRVVHCNIGRPELWAVYPGD